MRKRPTPTTIRALFAKSGNQCAFTGCTHPLINHKNQFVGQVCHIESAEKGGERFNEDQSDDDRRSFNNLMLMCYAHHVETNDTELFTAEKLRGIKHQHELNFAKSDYKIDEAALHQVMAEMSVFWDRVEQLNTLEHSFKDMAYDIKAKSSFFEIMKECRENVEYIQKMLSHLHQSDEVLEKDFHKILERKSIVPSLFEDIPYYENPFISRNWEFHNLSATNRMLQLHIHLVHLELKYLEEYLKTNSNDGAAKERLAVLKSEFADIAQHAAMAD